MKLINNVNALICSQTMISLPILRQFLILSFILMVANGFAQFKDEREFRITKDSFPQIALQSMQTWLAKSKRVRYFKELDGSKISFETKFKFDHKHYSVEFNEHGVLEDIEVYIDVEEIQKRTLKKMKRNLKNDFSKHRVIKVQRQFVVNKVDKQQQVIEQARIKYHAKNIHYNNINYELIIAGKNNDGFNTYEMLFNAEGDVIEKRKLVSTSYDPILY